MSSSICLLLLPGPDYFLKSRTSWAQLAVTFSILKFTSTVHLNFDAAIAVGGLIDSGYCSRRTDRQWLL
jgi:hypothetical protein